MAFPRFTKGRAGGLTFDTMNEVFDRIEALEGSLGTASAKSRGRMQPFLGRLLTLKPGTSNEWSFSEVTYPASLLISVASPDVQGGRRSTDGVDPYAYPAVGEGLTPNQVVMLFPMNRDSSTVTGTPPDPRNGKLIFHAMPVPSQDVVAQVVGYTAMTTGKWRYSVQRADIVVTGTSTAYFINPNEAIFTAYNGAENPTDSAGSYGVGSAPPGAITSLTRNPIKVGTVVTVTRDRNGYWTFSVPNGYSVTC